MRQASETDYTMDWPEGLLPRIEGFLAVARAKNRKTISTEAGPRYIRVVSSDGMGSRYSYCFIDKTTGDVLKAARPVSG